MRFSQRIGKTKMQTTIQKDKMTASFRNRIDNKLRFVISEEYCTQHSSFMDNPIFMRKYCDFFGYKEDDWNMFSDIISLDNFIKKIDEISDVYHIYDIIEFLVSTLKLEKKTVIIKQFNNIFELEKSAYRFNKTGTLIPITDEIELAELNRASVLSKPYANVYEHLEKAKSFFSNRKQPDYDKTVVESINAIEAVCRIIIKDKSIVLSNALKKLDLHVALKDSLIKLYSFCSDTVRHAKKDKNEINENEARLILINSHSIVNYLISKNL